MHGCGYVVRLAAYDFTVFEYHAEKHTHPYIMILSLFIVGFYIFRILTRIRIRAYGFLA